jgi:hypothetical protein
MIETEIYLGGIQLYIDKSYQQDRSRWYFISLLRTPEHTPCQGPPSICAKCAELTDEAAVLLAGSYERCAQSV